MDSSRYKRREIQTKRQTVDGFTGVRTPRPVVARRPITDERRVQPLPVDGIVPSVSKVQSPEAVTTTPGTDKAKSEGKSRQSRIDMGLPGGESQFHGQVVVHRSKWIPIRRWAFRTVAALLIITIGVGGLLFSQGYLKLHKVFKGGTKTAAALTANVNPDLLKGEGDGRVNVLLLGRGGGNHDGPDLTDTMMVASIDPVNHTAALLSIPRDLWVDVPDQGSMKINAAWETGEFNYEGKIAPGSTDPRAIQAGFTEADQTVESVLGVTIDYNAIVDFAAFQQGVNSVGGVAVNVPTELYDPTMAWENKGNPILAQVGLQTFTGEQALNYVRSRETTSDFARAQRQRAMLLALKQKVETLGTLSNPVKISNLMSAFGNNVSTDLSLSNADRLYSIMKDITNTNVSSIGLADAPNNYITTSSADGQSIDIPTAGMFDYDAIQSFVRSQLKDPYIVKENAKIMLLNGTTEPGLATNEESLLKSYGYNVTSAGDAPSSGYQTTEVIDLNSKDKYTDHYLEQRFNTTALTKLPAGNTIQTNGADFVIILGDDQTTPG
jgi:polyisoprenyl-teichoic acid--peptidoglycan teichoic acid transferase